MEPILFTIEDNIAWITLCRPDKYNAVNQALALTLQEALTVARDNEEVRAIYLTGIGKAFCTGQDISEIVDPEGPDINKIVGDHFNPIVKLIREIEKPIVAAVNGIAAGAGANIALCCDVVVATESAYFLQAFSKIGLIPDSGGTYFLPRLIGFQKASALMMLAEKISAAEANRMGMIYKCFSDENFEKEAKAIVKKLAGMPTAGLGLTKRALNYSVHNDLDTQLGIEEQLQTTAGNTTDYKEGITAFVEKRKPVFTGK